MYHETWKNVCSTWCSAIQFPFLHSSSAWCGASQDYLPALLRLEDGGRWCQVEVIDFVVDKLTIVVSQSSGKWCLGLKGFLILMVLMVLVGVYLVFLHCSKPPASQQLWYWLDIHLIFVKHSWTIYQKSVEFGSCSGRQAAEVRSQTPSWTFHPWNRWFEWWDV